ncbi:M23 family metallopeptidase [Bartonella sp. HY406]|uniref:M23 family metallopeptidase n=1 Tax=Bartonella sp. HY406 TaxID=2979331 RepID=UPI0021C727C8|nr:M23 family metallopeptidase [Bartonella sp. HY406]UXN03430.1 M23 family metallopeptidase [Bartonella sp. HY406]
MGKHKNIKVDPGNEPAIIANGNRRPDRRQISARWLVGTLLTGLTSFSLMGVALFAALDGHEQLATPPELLGRNEIPKRVIAKSGGVKGDRLIPIKPKTPLNDNRSFELSMVQKVGGKEIVKAQAFELVNMPLAEEHDQTYNYPKFNALNLFEDVAPIAATNTASISYAVPAAPEEKLPMRDFPLDAQFSDVIDQLSTEEVEHTVKVAASSLGTGVAQVAALHYIDPAQVKSLSRSVSFSDALDVRIFQENVSIAMGSNNRQAIENYSEDILPFIRDEKIIDILNRANFIGEDADRIADALNAMTKRDDLPAGSILRLGVETDKTGKRSIVRASIYNDKKHVMSIALDDNNNFIRCAEPETTELLISALDGDMPIIRVATDKLPSVYDAVVQAALSYNMGEDSARQLVRMLANDVDMQSNISATDSLEVFYPKPDKTLANANPEILYVAATFGDIVKRYYRFQSQDGKIDYYDREGRNSKQFLLRKPVPNGVFRSPFGPRRHPILGYVRMHTGVDWSAPRGAPIVAAGDGIVLKAGWSSGYGNHTEIQHANGYISSYSHQSAFAEGLKPGMHVRQGQVIGFVGSTGLSTGPHLHYEIVVNGTKVDPMRIRLPDEESLRGDDLIAFKRERDHIDALMKNGPRSTQVASSAPLSNS